MNIDVELLTDEDIYQRVMREDIPAARHSVLILTALVKQTIIEMEQGEYAPFLKLASDLASRGVSFFLMFAGKPSKPFLKSYLEYCQAQSRIKIRLCTRNHMKIVLIDGKKLYLGSANLTGAGMGRKGKNKRNFEFGFFTKDQRIIQSISKSFQEIWDGTHCGTCQVKKYCVQEYELLRKALEGLGTHQF
jgi:phosphatidylserine/phosphatidylglycerophosphate/cardiolipin synthase-like enzyme